MPDSPEQLDYVSFVDYAIDRVTAGGAAVDPVAMRLVLTLHRVTSALVYDVESGVHRPRGLSWPGFRVLFVLWLAGPLEAKRVAELSGMSRAAVSALVNTLERDGLVSRSRAEHDGRAVTLALTPGGIESITDAYLAHNAREQVWASALTGPEQRTLIGLLQKLMDGPAAESARRRT
ncbi:DNA-binding MarR family transcriptional regulator [Kutzneria viridogrisea]|uniref:MarR family transcription regulator n=2 Tax=Kutzneria TaxID=43356 RepID=W5W4G3_9PSEU|nr:MarR family winged helix-turn-helix transcriptional regulator [Kutzneria albida]AHH95645.1 MarR family transcription regulator [Kutzneria albida DSM 43870]MBA8926992.1 DNA-binding MarR family transcriptional regulator [Kutzneria viridogrisea]